MEEKSKRGRDKSVRKSKGMKGGIGIFDGKGEILDHNENNAIMRFTEKQLDKKKRWGRDLGWGYRVSSGPLPVGTP